MRLLAPIAACGLLAASLALAGEQGDDKGKEKKEGVEPMSGGAFNLRIVSDSVPDFNSRENFARSALSGWKTEEEKALAQFRWFHRMRRVGSFAPEDAGPVLDPVLFFNSYGITFCSMISTMNCSLWEAGGRPGRSIDLPGHVVSEVFYDGAWHMFDNDFCNYFRNEKGAVAGAGELGSSRIHGHVADLRPGEFYIFDHCATASCPRGRIFTGPSSTTLADVAAKWYPDAGQVLPRGDYSGARAGHRYVLGIRSDESYIRYWRPLGTGKDFARLFGNGKDPAADGSPLKNSRSNGQWIWKPDLSDPAVLFASENVESGPQGLRARDAAKPASVVFRVMAANVATSASLRARTAGDVKFLASGNGGISWQPVACQKDKPGEVNGLIVEPVAGRLEYLLKAELAAGTRLDTLEIETITQVNPRALPVLRLGRNEIAAVSDEHLETITLAPRLSGGQLPGETISASGWRAAEVKVEGDPLIRADGKAELVLRVLAPRDIRHLRLACTAVLDKPEAEMEAAVSFDAGKTWRRLGGARVADGKGSARPSFETNEVPAGAREALLRCSLNDAGGGLSSVFAEVGFAPAGPRADYDVTYCWGEWRDGKWVERQHVERVAEAGHRYAINVGGSRPPRMNWIRIAPAGTGKPGYRDGEDAAAGSTRADYRLVLGRKISTGCAYTVSRLASEAFPDKGGRILTDGNVGLASFWGLEGINLSGKKNAQRVGELVVWEPGAEVVVTLDLGEVREAGGARICAVQPNEKVLYPEKMTVEVSEDGKEFVPAGAARWEDCFFPPGDEMLWEGADSPIYERLPAGGIISHNFPVVFGKSVKARYVRFRLAPPAGAEGKAGIGLWELEVYDRIEKLPWSEHMVLPGATQPR